ncbi:MAG TPA: DedA family protein [Candidatus Absconditabacterales bacterium]|nr:DedA family protein [Candidatus Absconditabacterales bacterium]
MTEILQPIITRYMLHINYRSVGLLMIIESSFIPFPSEVIVPPAGRKVAQGLLNGWLVMLFATIGALLGALINYYLALRLGRKIIYRLANTRRAHMILITKDSIEKSEEYFRRNGKISTFIGRLIPAIRQLISIPAGLAKMDIGQFILYTSLGAGAWNLILFIAGYLLGQHRDKIIEYNHIFKLIVYGILAFVILFFSVRFFLRRKKTNKTNI